MDALSKARARSSDLTFEDFIGLHTFRGWMKGWYAGAVGTLREIHYGLLALDEHQYLFEIDATRFDDRRGPVIKRIQVLSEPIEVIPGLPWLREPTHEIVVELRNRLDVLEVPRWSTSSPPCEMIEMSARSIYMTRESEGSLLLEFGERIGVNPYRTEFFIEEHPEGFFPDWLKQIDLDAVEPVEISSGEKAYDPKGSSYYKRRGMQVTKQQRLLGKL